jgi:signal transduction histidine kinase
MLDNVGARWRHARTGDAVAPVHRRRQPRAAHPARRHPRLRGADPTGPLAPEIEYSIARISSQTERMTTLVEDLLLLARLMRDGRWNAAPST